MTAQNLSYFLSPSPSLLVISTLPVSIHFITYYSTYKNTIPLIAAQNLDHFSESQSELNFHFYEQASKSFI